MQPSAISCWVFSSGYYEAMQGSVRQNNAWLRAQALESNTTKWESEPCHSLHLGQITCTHYICFFICKMEMIIISTLLVMVKITWGKKMHVKHWADYLAHSPRAINVTTVSVVVVVMTPRLRSLLLAFSRLAKDNWKWAHNSLSRSIGLLHCSVGLAHWQSLWDEVIQGARNHSAFE